MSARPKGLTATRWGGLRRTVAGVALTALAVGGLSAMTIASPPAAEAAVSPSQQWVTGFSPNSAQPGRTMTGTFGSTGITALVSVPAGNSVDQWPLAQGSLNTATGSQNVTNSLEPDPPADSASVVQALAQPGAGLAEDITFSKPLIAPILHVANLDGSYIDISGTSTTGATIRGTLLASNADLEQSGNRFNNAPVGANNGGCTTSEGCGSIQLNATSGQITSFRITNTAAVAGDGWAWSLSFPTAPLTKQFSPAAIKPGGTSQLTFTIANPANSKQPTLTPLDFTDKLPAGVTLKDDTFTNNGNCGTPTSGGITAGSDTVTAGNITVAAGATCTITVNVTATTQGTYTNDNSNLSTTVGNLVPNANTSLTVTDADIPTVTCTTDPVIFNTGYDVATGGKVANNVADARWTVAGGFTGLNYVNTTVFPAGPSAAALPPAGTTYDPALAGKVNNLWSDSQSGKSQWISADYVPPTNGQNQATGYGDWYYRYQFNLDPQVDPSTFQLDMSWLSDNTVAGVWVNNQAQTGANLPQDPDNAWGGGGFAAGNAATTSMAGDWKTGLNTILVQVKSFYPAEGFNAEVTSSALCPPPALTIAKSAENLTSGDTSKLNVGDKIEYTVTAKNTALVPFTADAPATVTDDMSDVIDDATLDQSSLKATVDGQTVGAPTFDSPTLSWSGPLDPGATVTLTYTVTYNGDGNAKLVNNACVPEGTQTDGTEPCQGVILPAPRIVPWKTVEASSDPVEAGTTLTYTLHFDNTGSIAGPVNEVDDLTDVLDDATVTTEPATATGPLTATRNGNTITVTGDLDAGQSSTITYTVTVNAVGDRGNNRANNYLVKPGENPPTKCTPTDTQRPDCTSTPIAALVPGKSVDPDSGRTVVAGQVLTYTLTFDNSKGTDAAPVTDYTDDLSKVLDDADVTTQPAASIDSLKVGAIENGSFPVTGSVPAGKVGTVTYKVTVKADGQRGDNTLDNSLLHPNVPPVETHNPVSQIVPSKTVDPESGSTVKAGQVLTYTLTFTNKGAGAGTVNYTDDMTKVLDDATVTKDPTVSNPALKVASVKNGYAITGTLQGGQTATVTYQVTVKPDGKRGDNDLSNALVDSDPDHPHGPPVITENPVPYVTHAKTVDPTSTTPVVPGQVLTYTLTYKNTGKAAGTVDDVDDLTQAIDDATVTKQPTVTGGNLTATPFGSDNRSHITGSLPAGATVTITYQLTVKAAGQLGDGEVANFVLDPHNPPPSSPDCKPTDEQNPDCTVNPVGELKVSKIVDPKTGTTVHPGDTLHFTLSFENVGKGAIKVNYVDDMTGVLDDATVTTQPVASNQALTVTKVTDGKAGITGSLSGGQKVIVTYAVTTKPWAQQGDHVMENYLDPVGDHRAPRCVSTDPLCTTNPIAGPPAAGLAFTGTELVGPGIALALMLLALGGGLLVVRRRRQQGEETDNA